MQCRLAQLDGARVGARAGQVMRPCEPLDVLAVVDRLYRRRRLLREHLEVLADYGRRLLPPEAAAASRYHHADVHPAWARGRIPCGTLGDFVFYP